MGWVPSGLRRYYSLRTNELISGFQSRYVEGNGLGAQLRCDPTTKSGHGTDDYVDDDVE